jgi:D-alanine-D-alanine ligase-like ATP-grasp enzyme
MMIVSGVNLYPAEIEECLRSFPGVADALATPLRHPQLQDLPVALVVAAPGVALDAQALMQHVHNQIGRHTLHDLVFVERIPRNEQGKVQRKVVSEIVRARWGAGSNTSAPTGTLTLGFKLPPKMKPGTLNAWLTILEAPTDQALPVGLSGTNPSATDDGQIWLQQVLTLAQGLLHVLRIPLFDPVDIVQCRRTAPASEHWEAVCRVPDPSLLTRPLFEGVLKLAFRLAVWASKADAESTADRERFFQMIEKDVVRAFAKAKPNGKSTFEVLRVAHSLGVPYLPLPNGAFQLGWGRHARRIDRSTTDRDSAMGMYWTQNKLLTAQLLRQAGLPGPAHAGVKSLERAREVAERFGYPVVVKPADLERGEGVSVDVRAEGLEAAFNEAHKRSPGKLVLVEQQAPGVCHRLFIAAGKLLYAVKRLPIGVYADGRSTIRALVAAECAVQQRLPPWKRSGIQPLDELALHMLQRQGWQPETVPQAGQFVALRRIETTAWGGVDEEVTHTIHPDNVSAAIAAAQVFGLEVAGVDMISRNIQQPWHANGAVINEVNYAPLLGGGEISRRYIGEYLARLLKDRGQIPIHVYAGDKDACSKGKTHYEALRAAGIDAYLVDEHGTLDSRGNPCVITASSMETRVRALLMRQDVQALVLLAPASDTSGWLDRLAGKAFAPPHADHAIEIPAGPGGTN